ncbi:hypothetical protein BSKO_00617 [Bryopsis sp. KO-2023]|nr:hypothetical protein BSKO_00617 [Bryopsis sp. KO-2023]
MESESKIEQYLSMAKSASGSAVSEVIERALVEPGLFAFGELLELPSVRQLETSDQSQWFELLGIFAYGVWEDYTARGEALPQLSGRHQLKLRQLTVISLASEQKVLPYPELMKKLGIPNVRQLEDMLITECFYMDIVKGKLDQKQSCLIVHDAISRDVKKSSVNKLVTQLTGWLDHSEELLGAVQQRIDFTQGAAQMEKARKELANDKREKKLQDMKDSEIRGPALQELDMIRNPLDIGDEERLSRSKREQDYIY